MIAARFSVALEGDGVTFGAAVVDDVTPPTTPKEGEAEVDELEIGRLTGASGVTGGSDEVGVMMSTHGGIDMGSPGAGLIQVLDGVEDVEVATI